MEKEELREFLIDQLHCDLVKICNVLGSAACKDSKRIPMINTIIRIIFNEPFVYHDPKTLLEKKDIIFTKHSKQIEGQLMFNL